MKTVDTNALRLDLGEILNHVQYRGEKYVITRRGRPAALLGPVHEVVSDPTASLLSVGVTAAGAAENSAENSEKTPKTPAKPKKKSRKPS